MNALRAECAAVEDGPFRAGDIIGGQYEVQTLHRGGFGVVYICRQLGPAQYARSGNLVALKTPLRQHLGSPELREMFIEEAAHCVALGPHPNLVLTYGVTEYNRLPFLVMEYIPEARSLQGEIIAGKTDWTTTLPAALGIARGLAFAKLVHGDLKPVNILLGADGAAKVADFGLSVSVDDSIGNPAASAGPHAGRPRGLWIRRLVPPARKGSHLRAWANRDVAQALVRGPAGPRLDRGPPGGVAAEHWEKSPLGLARNSGLMPDDLPRVSHALHVRVHDPVTFPRADVWREIIKDPDHSGALPS